ncbi:hypothetical protein D3C87_1858700 [compost metagenome]
MQLLQMLDKENTIFTKDKRNTLGMVDTPVLAKDKAEAINWLISNKEMVIMVVLLVGQMMVPILQILLKNTLLMTSDYTTWLVT